MHFGFAWPAPVIFMLPMLINIVYAVLPPKTGTPAANGKYPFIEGVEQVTRILYLIVLCLLISNRGASLASPYLYIAAAFLILYYICWMRYFFTGRDLAVLGKPLLCIPQPLAVFPVLYFLFAALWLHNYPAVAVMLVFGIAHNIVTYRNRKAVNA